MKYLKALEISTNSPDKSEYIFNKAPNLYMTHHPDHEHGVKLLTDVILSGNVSYLKRHFRYLTDYLYNQNQIYSKYQFLVHHLNSKISHGILLMN